MALETVVSVVVVKLADLLIQEATFLSGVGDKVEWIQTELRQMQHFLRDADEKQQNDSNVKNWVEDIRDVAFDAEDVLETYILKRTLRKKKNFVRRHAFIFNGLYTHHKICMEITQIQNKIREISDRRLTYGIEAIGGGSGEVSKSANERLRERRRTSPRDHDDETQVVGLVNNVNALKDRLIGQPPRRCVISIIGMGGLGKTTLAKMVYNCYESKRHFKCRVWVYVSQVYDIKDLLQEIAKKSMGVERDALQKMNEEELEDKINGFLKERRYLIVMDDVWESNVWDRLKSVFPNTNNGSRIIFTTRNKEVASHADPKSVSHELQPLSNDDSWELFIKRVLSVEENTLPKELEAIGKSIVEKCGGLPLAIEVLGGFLSRRGKSFGEWSKVLARVNWQLNQDQTPCSQILALSYNDLPFYLKSCFLYLGIFPEDYEISGRNLIKLWISEGFIEPRGDEVAEDIAEDYLEELANRCMIQIIARRPSGSIKKCCVHDLLRDLAISEAKKVKFFHIHPNANSSSTSFPQLNKIRRLSVHPTIHNFSVDHSNQYIRSAFYFLLLDHKVLYGVIHSSVSFGLLRVLHISGNGYLHKDDYPDLPKAIGKLIHLRFLRLRYVRVKMFSSTIGNLKNLQILNLEWTNVKCDRDAISKMDHLRHLKLGTFDELRLDPPSGNGSSCSSTKNLRTLLGLFIDEQSLVKDGWDKYTNIRKLRLFNDLESQVEALAGWIAKLEHLEYLYLDFTKKSEIKFRDPIERLNIFSRNRFNLYELVLKGVWIEKLPDPREFPSNFSYLSLDESMLGKETFLMLGKLPNLKFLMIRNSALKVKDIIILPGRFPQLEELLLMRIDDLEGLRVEKGALPCLRELSINFCSNLKVIPDGLQHITTLQKLDLIMPYEFISRVRRNVGEDWEKIAHVPTIRAVGV